MSQAEPSELPKQALRALEALDEKRLWQIGVDALPPELTPDVARVLDQHGYIEVREPGAPWYSPNRSRRSDFMGDWPAILNTKDRRVKPRQGADGQLERGPCSFDVRVSPEGKARLAELRMTEETHKRRGKTGDEKWRKALKRMIALRRQRKLPSTLRQATKLLGLEGFFYDTVRKAAHESSSLRQHFGLEDRNVEAGTSSPVDELAEQVDGRTRQFIARMTPQRRQEAEKALREMPPEQRADLLETLAVNPDAGHSGDVPFIETADQDGVDDDFPE